MLLVNYLNPRGFSGAPIDLLNRKVRLIYLDEAGISNPAHEPYLVIAGIIINADQDWRPLQRHLQSIARRFLPSEDEPGFIFHAKDIFHGSGYFVRDRWPRERRMEIFAALADIPRRFHLPIVAGFVERAAAATYFRNQRSTLPGRTVATLTHASAFVRAVAQVDIWMGMNAPAEVAMLVAENVGKMQSALKIIHAGTMPNGYYDPRWADIFKVDNIVDTVHFAAKDESILLQIADLCAFTVKRHIMGKTDINEPFAMLRGQIISPLDPSVGAS